MLGTAAKLNPKLRGFSSGLSSNHNFSISNLHTNLTGQLLSGTLLEGPKFGAAAAYKRNKYMRQRLLSLSRTCWPTPGISTEKSLSVGMGKVERTAIPRGTVSRSKCYVCVGNGGLCTWEQGVSS